MIGATWEAVAQVPGGTPTPGQVLTPTSTTPVVQSTWFQKLSHEIPWWGKVLGVAAIAFVGYKLWKR